MPIEVVAHRGASEDVPEHTLAAYLKAIADGADALECDVRLTRDGHLVCVHDRKVDRTSDGRGVVSVLELSDLQALDFGSWHGQRRAVAGRRSRLAGRSGSRPPAGRAAPVTEAPDRDRRGILTLTRLLEVVADAGRPVRLAVETKHPTRYAGLVEERLVDLLDRFGWAHPRTGESSPVRVMSFSQLSVRRIREMAPSLPTVLLMERVPLRLRDGGLPYGLGITGPDIEIVRRHPGYVRRAQSRGHQVHVWTVDEPSDVSLCIELGVDAIITNRPRMVLDSLGR